MARRNRLPAARFLAGALLFPAPETTPAGLAPKTTNKALIIPFGRQAHNAQNVRLESLTYKSALPAHGGSRLVCAMGTVRVVVNMTI